MPGEKLPLLCIKKKGSDLTPGAADMQLFLWSGKGEELPDIAFCRNFKKGMGLFMPAGERKVRGSRHYLLSKSHG